MKAKRLLLAGIAGLGLTLVTLWGMGGVPVPIVLAAGNTWYVSPGGTGDCSTSANACATIATALTKASDTPADPDTIVVATGIYTEYNIVVTKSVIIQGAGASNTIVQASIDGTESGRRVFEIRDSANATIADMTIRNGNYYLSGDGGGVYVDNATLTLQDTIVLSNSARNGGGVRVYGASAAFTQTGVSTITGNSADVVGGGVSVSQGSATLNGGQISFNSADYGGGVDLTGNSATLTLQDTIVLSNSAEGGGGGGVYVWDGSAALSGAEIISNSGYFGGGVKVGSGSATLSGGEISFNHASANSGGGVHVGLGSATLSGMRLLHNTAAITGGGLYNLQGTLSVTDSCIVNNLDTAVEAAGGQVVTATHNWWGAPTGPSMGMRIPGYGDSVSSDVISGSYKSTAPPGCPTLTADLVIAKTVSPAADVAYHGSVTYTVTLSNTGIKDAASGTLLTDTLSTEVDFARWVQQSGADVASDQITWSGAVTEGESITWSWVVTHSGGFGDVVTNVAEYSHPASGQSGSADAAFTVLWDTTYLPVVSKGATP